MSQALPAAGRAGARRILPALALVLVAMLVLSLVLGAVAVPPDRVLAALMGQGTGRDAVVVLQLRLPRAIMGGATGAALAVAGATLQGLFRNPLADPGLIGVSSGAALAAAVTIVLGGHLTALLPWLQTAWLLPVAAFAGGLVATRVVGAVATRDGVTSAPGMLLAGIAVNAIAMALVGLLVWMSDDRQLRDFTFWTLGSLAGADWPRTALALPLLLVPMLLLPRLALPLNAMMLGEREAGHLGVAVQRIKRQAVVLSALAVGAAVAATGLIGFVGLVVPHLVRLVAGPDQRLVIPGSALLGASLLMGADALARTLAAPAELPVGLLTSAIGGPFFLWLLTRRAR
ncbi:FecCD family ABC transporter permease [Arenibaculum pallidiluteum]|uniref:FecCD family ABC transporter permease n=1 Tax=Arenibaculum pallidiluteum TaxID=2812559 RepID=UPI001A97C76E|nr:iron ABC transporter permease [Arenibaculum pallidiluteum]